MSSHQAHSDDSKSKAWVNRESKTDPNIKMKAIAWYGTRDMRVIEKNKPMVTHPSDAIVRVTSASICGSDLHFYTGMFPEMVKGDIVGHESMGVVESVGPEVKDIRPGQRVVVSAVIADGVCEFCQKGMFSLCDHTNDSENMEKMFGSRTAGLFGYSHLTGGYDGGQAEYVRVPFADVNLLPVPDRLSDEQVLLLSDACCTGYHATEAGDVQRGKSVAVWGCGPVGLMALAWAKFKGASKLIAIDSDERRLQLARDQTGAITINFKNEDVVGRLKELSPGGPEVCIEAAGYRYTKSIASRIQTALRMETDSVDTLNEIFIAVRKGGSVAITGDYVGYVNQFPIGALMNKAITVRSGQLFAQKYWKDLLSYIDKGQFDPTFILTHKFKLEEAAKAYTMFENHEDGLIKCVLKTDFGLAQDQLRNRGTRVD